MATAQTSAQEAPGQWLGEAQQAWAKYREICDRYQGTIASESFHEEQSALTALVQIKQGDNACELITTDLDSPDRKYQRTYCVNSQYAFILQRAKAEDGWAIEVLEKTGDHLWFQQYGQTLRSTKHALAYLSQSNLWDLVQRDSFKIISEKHVHVNGRDLLHIEFDNAHPVLEEPFCRVQSGSITLDPAAMYCLAGANLQTEGTDGKKPNELKIEYNVVGGVPIPVRRESILQTEHYGTYTNVLEFNFELPDELPKEAEFRLPAFGIAEAEGYFTMPQLAELALQVDTSELAALLAQPLAPGDHEVTFLIKNTSEKEQRVVGVLATCFEGVCTKTSEKFPMTVPARATVPVKIVVQINERFDAEFYGTPQIYLEDNGTNRSFTVPIQGRTIPRQQSERRNLIQ